MTGSHALMWHGMHAGCLWRMFDRITGTEAAPLPLMWLMSGATAAVKGTKFENITTPGVLPFLAEMNSVVKIENASFSGINTYSATAERHLGAADSSSGMYADQSVRNGFRQIGPEGIISTNVRVIPWVTLKAIPDDVVFLTAQDPWFVQTQQVRVGYRRRRARRRMHAEHARGAGGDVWSRRGARRGAWGVHRGFRSGSRP
jgi:hypothetical protein